MNDRRPKSLTLAKGRYLLAIESTYMQANGEPAAVTWYTCLRCGSAVIELGPNTEGRMVHDLWHLAFGVNLQVPVTP